MEGSREKRDQETMSYSSPHQVVGCEGAESGEALSSGELPKSKTQFIQTVVTMA